jgi:Fe-S-cluster containining protein
MQENKEEISTSEAAESAATPRVNGCCGECCREFPLSTSYEDLRAEYQAWLSQSEERLGIPDIHILFPMLRKTRLAEDGRQLYRCVHWDPETTLCGIYEIRPEVCSQYPYEGECHVEGCGHNLYRTQENLSLLRDPACSEQAEVLQQSASLSVSLDAGSNVQQTEQGANDANEQSRAQSVQG